MTIHYPAEQFASTGFSGSLLADPSFSIPEGNPRNWAPSANVFQEEPGYVAHENDLIVNSNQLDLNPQPQAPDAHVMQPTPNLSRASSFTTGTNSGRVATGFARKLSAALENVVEDRKTVEPLPSSDDEDWSESAHKLHPDRKESNCSTSSEFPGVYQYVSPEQVESNSFFGFGSIIYKILWEGICNAAVQSHCQTEDVFHHSTAPPQEQHEYQEPAEEAMS